MTNHPNRSRSVCLSLTRAEARALETVASDGLEGIGTDEAASKAYLGGKRGVDAATVALQKLRHLIY